MAKDLIVDDNYFSSLASFFRGGYELEHMLEAYLSILEKSRADAVKSGAAADAIDAYMPYIERLQGKADDIKSDLDDLCLGYIRAIDAADDYLF